MYCPRCAAQNLDDAKFCRACGTNLETVALALSDRYPFAQKSKDQAEDPKPEKSWLEKRKEGVSNIVQGSGLLGSSLLIGIALGLFSNQPEWIMIWLVFVGWMACWGVISLVSGIGALMESKFMLRQIGPIDPGMAPYIDPVLPAPNRGLVTDELTAPRLTPPSSVTEHTTNRLTKPESPSKRTN